MDSPAQRGIRVIVEFLAHPVIEEARVWTVSQAEKVSGETGESLEFQVNPAPQVETVPRDIPENPAPPGHRAPPVRTALRDRVVNPDLPGLEVRKECPATLDSQVKRGQEARTGQRGQLVQLGLWVIQEK